MIKKQNVCECGTKMVSEEAIQRGCCDECAKTKNESMDGFNRMWDDMNRLRENVRMAKSALAWRQKNLATNKRTDPETIAMLKREIKAAEETLAKDQAAFDAEQAADKAKREDVYQKWLASQKNESHVSEKISKVVKIVRGKKVVKKATDKEGYKLVDGKEVRMSSAEIRRRKRAALKASKTKSRDTSGQLAAAKSRRLSMIKRGKTVHENSRVDPAFVQAQGYIGTYSIPRDNDYGLPELKNAYGADQLQAYADANNCIICALSDVTSTPPMYSLILPEWESVILRARVGKQQRDQYMYGTQKQCLAGYNAIIKVLHYGDMSESAMNALDEIDFDVFGGDITLSDAKQDLASENLSLIQRSLRELSQMPSSGMGRDAEYENALTKLKKIYRQSMSELSSRTDESADAIYADEQALVDKANQLAKIHGNEDYDLISVWLNLGFNLGLINTLSMGQVERIVRK